MINKSNIKTKDFSYDLSNIANKLDFIGLSMTAKENMDGMLEATLGGAGNILLEIAGDLQVIKEALYGNDKKSAPETEASPEDGQGQK